MRAAFASKDGKFVSQHFGHTPFFCIVDIDEDDYSWRFVEMRENAPPCNMGEHDEKAFARSVDNVSDCGALFAVQVGQYARIVLQRRGIQVLEAAGYIEELLEKYVIYLKRAKPRH